MIDLILFLAVTDIEPSTMLFKRLGEQAFLVILLVLSNWLFAKTLLMVRREHIGDIKQQITDLKELLKDTQAERDLIWNFFATGHKLPHINEPTNPPPPTDISSSSQ